MKRLSLNLTAFLLFTIFIPMSAQKQGRALLDSMLTSSRLQKEDTGHVMTLKDLSFQYLTFSPDSGKIYAEKAIELAARLNYKRGLASANNALGLSESARGSYYLAEQSLQRSLLLHEQTGNKKGMATNYRNLGVLYYEQGIYSNALTNARKALKLFQQTKSWEGECGVRNNIGIIFMDKGDYDSSFTWFAGSLEIARLHNDKRGIVYALNNYSRSLQKQCLQMKIAGNPKILNLRTEKRAQALQFAEEAMKLSEELQETFPIVLSCKNLGAIKTVNKRDEDGFALIKRGLEGAKKLQNVSQEEQLQALAGRYHALGAGGPFFVDDLEGNVEPTANDLNAAWGYYVNAQNLHAKLPAALSKDSAYAKEIAFLEMRSPMAVLMKKGLRMATRVLPNDGHQLHLEREKAAERSQQPPAQVAVPFKAAAAPEKTEKHLQLEEKSNGGVIKNNRVD